MIAAPFAVVLDANVLYPFSLRDCLLRAAEEGLYQVLWSEQILEEVRRNLVANGVMPDTSAQRLIQVMNEAFPEALTSVSDGLIARMRNHPKDRHVVAAAVSAGAQLIVTSNLRDFKVLPAGIEALSPTTSCGTSSTSTHRCLSRLCAAKQRLYAVLPARSKSSLLAYRSRSPSSRRPSDNTLAI